MSWIAIVALAPAACAYHVANHAPSVARAPVSSETCDAAHDHCIRPQTWFLSDTRPSPGRTSHVTPVYERDGCWLDYTDSDDYARRGVLYHTAPATIATVTSGD